jgi:hypothetical protein
MALPSWTTLVVNSHPLRIDVILFCKNVPRTRNYAAVDEQFCVSPICLKIPKLGLTNKKSETSFECVLNLDV